VSKHIISCGSPLKRNGQTMRAGIGGIPRAGRWWYYYYYYYYSWSPSSHKGKSPLCYYEFMSNTNLTHSTILVVGTPISPVKCDFLNILIYSIRG
jgi:hypothetical protein